MDKEKIDKIVSLAKMLGLNETFLVEKAKLVQPGLERAEDMNENAYFFLAGTLLAKGEIVI